MTYGKIALQLTPSRVRLALRGRAFCSLAMPVVLGVFSHVGYSNEIDWAAIASRDNNGTVLIHVDWVVKGSPEQYLHSDGTGFVVGDNRRILTVAHLVPREHENDAVISGQLFNYGMAAQAPQGELVLKLRKIDREADYAIFEADDPSSLVPIPVDLTWSPGEGDIVHARGFPSGGPLEGYDGKITRTGSSDTVPTTTLLEEGYSGGPVYGADGTVVGMVRGGVPVIDLQGHPELMGRGFIVPLSLLVKGMDADYLAHIRRGPSADASTADAYRRPGEVRINYPVDETKETYFNSLMDLFKKAESKDYTTGKIYAQPGYRISSYTFSVFSGTRYTKEKVTIPPDGGWIEMSYTLTSGPGWDRWRGWLTGTLTTVQLKR